MKLFLIYWVIMLFLEKKKSVLICKLDQLFNTGTFCHLLFKPSSKPSSRLVMKNVFCRFFTCHVIFYPQ